MRHTRPLRLHPIRQQSRLATDEIELCYAVYTLLFYITLVYTQSVSFANDIYKQMKPIPHTAATWPMRRQCCLRLMDTYPHLSPEEQQDCLFTLASVLGTNNDVPLATHAVTPKMQRLFDDTFNKFDLSSPRNGIVDFSAKLCKELGVNPCPVAFKDLSKLKEEDVWGYYKERFLLGGKIVIDKELSDIQQLITCTHETLHHFQYATAPKDEKAFHIKLLKFYSAIGLNGNGTRLTEAIYINDPFEKDVRVGTKSIRQNTQVQSYLPRYLQDL